MGREFLIPVWPVLPRFHPRFPLKTGLFVSALARFLSSESGIFYWACWKSFQPGAFLSCPLEAGATVSKKRVFLLRIGWLYNTADVGGCQFFRPPGPDGN